jgi:hypothetical protein
VHILPGDGLSRRLEFDDLVKDCAQLPPPGMLVKCSSSARQVLDTCLFDHGCLNACTRSACSLGLQLHPSPACQWFPSGRQALLVQWLSGEQGLE